MAGTYEQMVAIYATIKVNAKDRTEAKRAVNRQIQRLSLGFAFDEEEILVGDVERVSEIYGVETLR